MLQLKNLELPKKLVTFTDLQSNVEYALKARILSMSNYSGYPIASNVTGRLQKQFDFSSVKNLLESAVRNRNLVKFAGDVLNLVPIASMQKYQMSRADVGAFITNHAAAHGMTELSTEEKDFVSYLMTSSESMASHWLLEHSSSPESNLHLKFANMYSELLMALGTDHVAEISCYDADSDKISTLLDTPRGSLLSADISKKKNDKKKGEKIDDSELRHMITVEVLSTMRILDHFHALFMSMEPWHMFISPRTTAETNTNVARAGSLQLMAGYMHSLLLYPYHLKAEMFLGLYEKVQKWLVPLPAMPAHLKTQYDETIRHTDTLGAVADAHEVINANDFESDDVINSSLVNFYREQIGLLGMGKIDTEAVLAAAKAVGFSLNDLKTLGDPQYQNTLLAQPIRQLTIIPSVIQALMVADVMENFVMNCSSSIAGLSSRFHSPVVLDKLKTIAFKVHVTFLPKLTPVLDPKQVSENVMDGGKLSFAAHLPGATRSYDLHIQRDLINTVFTPGRAIEKFNTQFIINEDIRSGLEKLLPRFTQTLMPESLHSGFHSISREAIIGSVESRRSLFENLTGMSYPLMARAVVSNLFLMDFATTMSSFCFVFESPGQVGVGDIYKIQANRSGPSDYSLVQGYGSPFGTSYEGLMSMQNDLKPEDYLPIAPGVAIVLLKTIPALTFNLKVEEDFINQHPYPYFASNGDSFAVTDFVYAKPLVNFALMPAPASKYHPAKFFLDKNYVYANQQVYIEVNLNQIATPAKRHDGFNAPFTKRNWSFEKYQYFAEYVTPGDYGPAGVATSLHEGDSAASTEAKRVSDMVKAAEEKMKAMDVDKPQDKIVDADPSLVKESQIKELNTTTTTHQKAETSKEDSEAKKKDAEKKKLIEDEAANKAADSKGDKADDETEDDKDKDKENK